MIDAAPTRGRLGHVRRRARTRASRRRGGGLAALVFFDCVHGAAGDMLLAALLDAGASLDVVRSALAACDLPELTLQTEEVTRSGLRGLHLTVDGGNGSGAGDLSLPMAALATAPLPARGRADSVAPTAAALLATLARFGVPAMRLHAVGCGAGTRDDPRRPNLVRAWLGEPAGGGDDDAATRFDDDCVELRTNLDDV